MEVSRTVTCAGYWDALVLGAMLEEQGKMLCEQGTTLNGHTALLTDQNRMLREVLERLPAA